MTDSPVDTFEARLFVDDRPPVVGEPLRLQASRCPACVRWEFPALDYCPGCSGPVEIGALSNHARVGGFTAVLHAPPGAQVEVPYSVVFASFPEGVDILGVVNADVDQLDLGDKVETVGVQVGDRIGYGFRLI
jgi:uncharacterized OB-fold protein